MFLVDVFLQFVGVQSVVLDILYDVVPVFVSQVIFKFILAMGRGVRGSGEGCFCVFLCSCEEELRTMGYFDVAVHEAGLLVCLGEQYFEGGTVLVGF